MRRGDPMVPLSDGGFGMEREEWLARFAPLANLGSREDDHLRFRQNQAGLLDALLAAQPEVRVDEVFERARQRLRDFGGVQAAPQPEGFSGQLRDYQREGVGWMHFLREFGFGGCLADDMGVGKTAQVLALSGTPVENHLGELWSLFEFLNPGMLGEARVLQMAGGLARNPSEDARRLLSQALRPFILRRTKQQVARELPEKTEQTIFCELEPAQRKQYDELRQHYRDTLLQRVEKQGLARSKMH